MRHHSIIISALAASAALLTAPVDACQARPGNHAYEPVMAEFVRDHSEIYLARVVAAHLAPTTEQVRPEIRPLYRYHFQVVETLKGAPVDEFEAVSTRPFTGELPLECTSSNLDRHSGACRVAFSNLIRRNASIELADNARRDWEAFYHLQPLDPPGMGTAETFHPDLLVIGCGNDQPGFEIGETFLVFRNGSEALSTRYGFNAHIIRRRDDAWLDAVQFFIANPSADYLPGRTVRESLAPFRPTDIVQFVACEQADPYPYLAEFSGATGTEVHRVLEDTYIRFYQRDEDAGEAREHCAEGGYFLLFSGLDSARFNDEIWPFIPPFPIRDGMVDFTHLATQWQIEGPVEIPISEVINWHVDGD